MSIRHAMSEAELDSMSGSSADDMSPSPTTRFLPFSALVGQEEMKLALILNAIDPGIGGVLLRGEKGTAKSTAVRALAALLPEIRVVDNCPFGCDPGAPQHFCPLCARDRGAALASTQYRRVRVVDLPLNATEDMVLGGLDFCRAIHTGRRHLTPGLLARAHRGFLYVDETNLLDDHLVDVILDAAACGVCRVEREGVSLTHPARFSLVGSMNPEEGELRPGLLDRFGLCIHVSGETDLATRIRLMEIREAFDADPQGTAARFEDRDRAIAAGILAAADLLTRVVLSGPLKVLISELCLGSHVAGHRADLVIERAARALAAYEGRREVTDQDIARIAPMALRHRSRDPLPPPPPPPQEDPPEPPEPPEQDQEDLEDEPEQPDDLDQGFDLPLPEPSPQEDPPEDDEGEDESQDEQDLLEKIFDIGETFKVKRLTQPKDRVLRRGSGRRSLTRTAQKQGRYVKSIANPQGCDLALDATIRAAAPYQKNRRQGRTGRLTVFIEDHDIRHKVREKRVGNFLVFAVDASGSMGARARMIATKGAVMSLLLDAYQKRDRVAMITFRGREAELNLPPTSSIDLAARKLKELPVGGRTPLASCLSLAHHQVRLNLLKDPTSRPLVMILTDGRTNVPLNQGVNPVDEVIGMAGKMAQDHQARYVVIDTEEQGIVRLGLARRLAQALGAEYFQIENLKSDDLVTIARRNDL